MNRLLTNIGLISLLIVASFFAGLFIGEKGVPGARATWSIGGGDPPQGVDLSPLWKAWQVLDQKFVASGTSTNLSSEDKVYGLIEGLAKAYGDPYTVFLPPEDSAMFEDDINGSFGGVGMEVGMRDDAITVIAPLKGTPAEREGIRAGDLVLEINGKSTQDMTVDEAVRNIRGKEGTTVTLVLGRKGEKELITKTVTREIIRIPTIGTTLRQDGIFVIELYNFGATAPDEFRKALRAFVASGSKNLVVDLRSNPGGFLDGAVDIASWFLPAGTPVVIEDYGQKQEKSILRSKGSSLKTDDWRVVVLVNEGSASASEIVAGALQEHKKAVLIGAKTFGKGSVQELVRITGDTSLKVTIARWLTPGGVSISENGLTPDIEVARTLEDFEAGRDPQLERAVEYLQTGK
jgi:carboxyl-terminal processing protease